MILVYTGDGKGKTCAAIGQAIRAHAQGLKVVFGQFMKQPGCAGEQIILQQLLGDRFLAGGLGFYDQPRHAEHKRKAQELLGWATRFEADLLILDEALYALGYELITPDELAKLIPIYKSANRHLALTGRNAPLWLKKEADILTSMDNTFHHHKFGIGPIKGIEY